MRWNVVAIALGLGLCVGCARSMEQRAEARVRKLNRQGVALLERIEREGYHVGEWPESANRLVFQLAPYAVDEMITRALHQGDNHYRHLMVRLLERTSTAGSTSGIGMTVGRKLGEVSDKEGKRIALVLHRKFPTQEGYRLALSLLEDHDSEVRMWAVGSLCSDPSYFGIRAAEEIAKRLHDKDRDVAKVAAGSMSFLKHAHVAVILREHAQRIEDPIVKDMALQSARNIEGALGWRGLPDWAKRRCPASPQPPEPFHLLSPADGTEGVSLAPRLDWEDAGYAETYQFELDTDDDFVGRLLSGDILHKSEYAIEEGVLGPDTWYYWRAKAGNAYGETVSTSGTWRFKTGPAQNPLTSPKREGDSGGPADRSQATSDPRTPSSGEH